MVRGRNLTSEEKAQIDALAAVPLSSRDISQRIKRSKSAVNDYLKREKSQRKQVKPGRPKKLSPRNERILVRLARSGGKKAIDVLNQSGLSVSLRTVQRTLFEHDFCDFEHLQRRPKLEPHHCRRRLKFAKKHTFTSVEEWRKTVFTDEKRFCLDGPDGTACFWGDRWLPRAQFSCRQRGGGGLMVWGGISWAGKTPLVVVNGNLNAQKYVDMLDEHFKPFRDEYYPNGCVFQQDGAPAHTALFTREYFMEKEMVDMAWPARSPDLNCIENCWGYLVMKVYRGARQFDSLDDLREALLYVWEELDMEYVRKLIASMPRRVWECYKKRGSVTKY